MLVYPITQYGDKILRKVVKPVKAIDDEIIRIVKKMFETMRNAYGVGLAANQVGLDKQIFVVDVSTVEDCEGIKPVAMINPQIILQSDEKIILEEGCLSLPSLRADVERAKDIRIKYLSTNEEEVEIEASNFFARVILHEYDHLIGKMIPDRIAESEKKKLSKLLKKIQNREVDCDYPVTELEI
ncbi:MAG: peptide deformylase [Ignavibacteriae bacterium]|nr:peptide deformylase [Ignavibacteriota bacterium]